jgi:hypothetical protein
MPLRVLAPLAIALLTWHERRKAGWSVTRAAIAAVSRAP